MNKVEENKKKDLIIAIIIFAVLMGVIAIGAALSGKSKSENSENSENEGKQEQITEEITYNYLVCYKTTLKDNYELSTSIRLNYRDGFITDGQFDYRYFKRNDNAQDGYTFDEIEEFKQLDEKGITKNIDGNHYKFTVDFENNKELLNHPTLKDYTYIVTTELNILQVEKGYSCSNDSEVKIETVDKETRKKLK